MYKLHGLIAVLILALINAKFVLTENDYYPGKCLIINMYLLLFCVCRFTILFFFFYNGFIQRIVNENIM